MYCNYVMRNPLDSPLRTASVCLLPPFLAWFVSSSAGSAWVAWTGWVLTDSVASLWTGELLLLSSRSARSWSPLARQSMTAPDWSECCCRWHYTWCMSPAAGSCGLNTLHRSNTSPKSKAHPPQQQPALNSTHPCCSQIPSNKPILWVNDKVLIPFSQ